MAKVNLIVISYQLHFAFLCCTRYDTFLMGYLSLYSLVKG